MTRLNGGRVSAILAFAAVLGYPTEGRQSEGLPIPHYPFGRPWAG